METTQPMRAIVRFLNGEKGEYNVDTTDYELARQTLLDQAGVIVVLVRIK